MHLFSQLKLINKPVLARASRPELPPVSEQLPLCQTSTATLHVTGLWPPLSSTAPPSHPPCPQCPQLTSKQPAKPHGSLRSQPQSCSKLWWAGGRLGSRLRHRLSHLRLLSAGQRRHEKGSSQLLGWESESVTATPDSAPPSAWEEEGIRWGAFTGNCLSSSQWVLKSPQWELPEYSFPQRLAWPLISDARHSLTSARWAKIHKSR